MDMLRVGQYAGFRNTYIGREIKTVDLETVKKQEQLKELQSEEQFSSPERSISEAGRQKASRTADLENISLHFNKNDDYGFIGRDANPETLDMQKAISDMQKDGILQEYQYFVGNSNFMPVDMGFGILQSATADGLVIRK